MLRKITAIVLSVLLLLTLCACSDEEPPVTSSGPGRMVRRIEVAIHPEDADFDRVYVTQENMNELLSLLRSMETDEEPEQEPDLEGGQTYYTATVTFANGEKSVYHLLGHSYLRLGDEDWCVVDPKLSLQFSEFIRNRPTDDGSVVIETTAPVETTVPAETTAPTETE